ncbi:MAG: metal ABC transporter solute-binding protein, Zn/Mn family [Micrococcales bacterium]
MRSTLRLNRVMLAAAAIVVVSMALTGCGRIFGGEPVKQLPAYTPHDGKLKVVTSIQVWADIAQTIGGDLAEVKSVITNPNQDPHSYQVTARDQLLVNQADLTVYNGGNYDQFFSTMAQRKPNAKRYMQTDVSMISHPAEDKNSKWGMNEHFWYDLETARNFSGEMVYRMGLGLVDDRQTLRNNQRAFSRGLDKLVSKQAALAKELAHKRVLMTESFAFYMVHNLQLENWTPPAYLKAVEDETDAPPSTMQEIEQLLTSHKLDAVIVNKQTETTQTTQITKWAKAAGVPVVELGEVLPANTSYLRWMNDNLDAISKALQ